MIVTKSQLKEAVREIVRRKLNERFCGDSTVQHGVDGDGNSKVIDAIAEIGATPDRTPKPTSGSRGAKFAYFTDKTKQNVMLVGYGQVSYSALKTKLVQDLNKMHDYAKTEKYDAVVSQWNNITKYVAEGLKELDQTMTEALDGTAQVAQPTVQMTADKQGKQLSQADQQKITNLEAEKSKATDDLERTKGELAKKTKPYTDKIGKLERKIGDTNIAIERIKA